MKKIGLLLSGSRSQRRVKMLMFVQMISSKPPNILFPNLVLWCIIMSWSVMQRDWFAIFKVTARAPLIKIWQFLLYPLNCWSFAGKLSLIVHYHKPECFMAKLDCCVQGHGHSKNSKCQWVFVQMIFSESLNLSATKLNMVMLIVSQIVFQKDWIAVFKIKFTVKDNTFKIWLFNMLSELLTFLQLNLVWWYIIIRWIVLWKDWIALLWSRSRSQKRFRIPVNVHLKIPP